VPPRHHPGVRLAAACFTPLDYRQLFKLRLVVAAMGETRRLGSRNSGVLTGTRGGLFQQGVPRTTAIAQAQAWLGFMPQQEESVGGEHKPWMDDPRWCMRHLWRRGWEVGL
jgi:hypothetical protein